MLQSVHGRPNSSIVLRLESKLNGFDAKLGSVRLTGVAMKSEQRIARIRQWFRDLQDLMIANHEEHQEVTEFDKFSVDDLNDGHI